MDIDWGTVIVAFIGAVPASIFAAAAWVQARSTHKAVNSRLTELLALTKKSATDAATLAEKDAQDVRAEEKKDVEDAGET